MFCWRAVGNLREDGDVDDGVLNHRGVERVGSDQRNDAESSSERVGQS